MSDREIELASNEIEIQNLDGTVTVARLDTAPKSEEERGAKGQDGPPLKFSAEKALTNELLLLFELIYGPERRGASTRRQKS